MAGSVSSPDAGVGRRSGALALLALGLALVFAAGSALAQSAAWMEIQLVPSASGRSTHWNQLVT